MNKVYLLGRLVRDPELKFAAGSGNAVNRFTVAVNRQFKKDETDFISCVAFGKTAELISQYFTKGRQIAILGSIRTGSYDAQDGTKRYTTDVIVESIDFIDSKVNNNTKPTDDFNTNSSDLSNNSDINPVDDEDMPF